MEEKRITANITEKARVALEKIAAFEPEKSKKQIVSELIIEGAKKYKGRKPAKKAVAKAPAKTVKKGR